ncbi:MFS transporter [Aliiglaciecola sp. 3_MG-2023]|uniref:MFS transporter n=1 Tax=Aliiglaciecola sp. 3_MG-2023 TaxID=3062644 RepID=UPI0026E36A43|nr:MFS transporter [Aliiglaciecola sp. 3_MG-2023]MDO6695293.1 MFS transporter [Aliiglaciecola sp. 3_MG-2023]
MTTAIAASAANLYYNQPILPLIANEFHLNDSQLGSIPALTQFGYAFALLFISPLGDSVVRRQLIGLLSCLLVVACSVAVFAPNLPILMLAVFLIGVSANITQQLIPFAASMVSIENKGATLGTLMMGLTIGILLSRTLSGFVAEQFGWRSVFIMSALIAAFLGILLWICLPSNKPQASLRYLPLLKSTLVLFARHRSLRLFTFSGAFWFAAFNVLWATLAIYVSDAPFHYNAQQAGLFGLIALAGVIGAKASGKWVNKLGAKTLIMVVLGLAALGFAITGLFAGNLVSLIVGIILIDFAVFSAQVANQVRVFSIDNSAQSRINGIYMLGYYLGGALGSIAGLTAYSLYQWPGVVVVSILFIIISAFFNALAKH